MQHQSGKQSWQLHFPPSRIWEHCEQGVGHKDGVGDENTSDEPQDGAEDESGDDDDNRSMGSSVNIDGVSYTSRGSVRLSDAPNDKGCPCSIHYWLQKLTVETARFGGKLLRESIPDGLADKALKRCEGMGQHNKVWCDKLRRQLEAVRATSQINVSVIQKLHITKRHELYSVVMEKDDDVSWLAKAKQTIFDVEIERFIEMALEGQQDALMNLLKQTTLCAASQQMQEAFDPRKPDLNVTDLCEQEKAKKFQAVVWTQLVGCVLLMERSKPVSSIRCSINYCKSTKQFLLICPMIVMWNWRRPLLAQSLHHKQACCCLISRSLASFQPQSQP